MDEDEQVSEARDITIWTTIEISEFCSSNSFKLLTSLLANWIMNYVHQEILCTSVQRIVMPYSKTVVAAQLQRNAYANLCKILWSDNWNSVAYISVPRLIVDTGILLHHLASGSG